MSFDVSTFADHLFQQEHGFEPASIIIFHSNINSWKKRIAIKNFEILTHTHHYNVTVLNKFTPDDDFISLHLIVMVITLITNALLFAGAFLVHSSSFSLLQFTVRSEDGLLTQRSVDPGLTENKRFPVTSHLRTTWNERLQFRSMQTSSLQLFPCKT